MEYTDFDDPSDLSTIKRVKESVGFSKCPKLNPEYDPDKEYINRENRKEWDTVGLLGKLYVNDDGSCKVGGYADVSSNGIVTATNEKGNMRVMKRITDNIIQVLYK